MADENPSNSSDSSSGGSAAATAKPKRQTPTKPKPPKMLPPWKVLLHNDDENTGAFVVLTIVQLTPLNIEQATLRMLEAETQKVSLLLVTHKERAELYQEQLQSKGLVITIEPAGA